MDTSHRSLFADFYGVDLAAVSTEGDALESPLFDESSSEISFGHAELARADPGDVSDQAATRSRMSSTSSFLEAEPAAVPLSERSNMDGKYFDAQVYVDNLLSEHGIEFLMQHNTQVVDSRKNLDSAMQMLLYDNYPKFIDATDKMQEMKDNVESMEEEMNTLLTNMKSIAASCNKIEDALAPNRDKVEDLVGVDRMLKRLDFLLELPGRLTKCVEIGQFSRAVKYYTASQRVLEQYAHIPSFQQIHTDSDKAIVVLKQQLQASISDPNNHISAEELLDNASMLLQLGSPLEELLVHVFRVGDTMMQAKMTQSKSRFEQLNADQPGSITMTQCLSEVFMMAFIGFVDPYIELFLRPLELQSQGEYSNSGPKQSVTEGKTEALLKEAEDSLLTFTKRLFDEYFTLVAEELLVAAQACALTDVLAAETAPQEVEYTALVELQIPMKTRLNHVQKILGGFYNGISAVAHRVPSADLLTRSKDTVITTLNAVTAAVFNNSKHCILKVLELFYQQAMLLHPQQEQQQQSASSPKVAAPTVVAAVAAAPKNPFAPSAGKTNPFAPAKSKNPFASPEAEEEQEPQAAAAEQKQKLSNSSSSSSKDNTSPAATTETSGKALVETVGRYVRMLIDSRLQLLVGVLSTDSYMPSGNLRFDQTVYSHATALLEWVQTTVSMGAPQAPQFHKVVLDAPSPSQLTQYATASPLYYLFLSHLCVRLESQELPKVAKVLQGCFSFQGAKQYTDMESKEHIQLQVKSFKVCAHNLLQAYVQHFSCKFASVVQLALTNVPATTVSTVRAEVIQCIADLTVIDAELQVLFDRGGEYEIDQRKFAGVDNKQNNTTSNNSSSNRATHNRSRGGVGARETDLNRHLERMFTKKVVVHADLKLNQVESTLVGVMKVLFRLFVDRLRATAPLSRLAFQQLQLDMFALRVYTAKNKFISSENVKLLETILIEVLAVGRDRCVEERCGLDEEALETLFLGQSSSVVLDGEEADLP